MAAEATWSRPSKACPRSIELVILRFNGELWHWRGPSPFHFITVPEDESAQIKDIAPIISYGWGVIPMTATIGRTDWTTSLFPKDGLYAAPVKDMVRNAEGLSIGDLVTICLTFDV